MVIILKYLKVNLYIMYIKKWLLRAVAVYLLLHQENFNQKILMDKKIY